MQAKCELPKIFTTKAITVTLFCYYNKYHFQNRIHNLHYEKFQDGTIKCIEDEIPFDVPEGWGWARLQSITSILTDGTHKTPQYSDAGYIFLSSKNVTSGKIDWDNNMYIPEVLHRELYTRLAPKAGDILLAKNGTTGVAAIVDREEVFDIYVSLALIRIVDNSVNPLYVLRAIESSFIQDYFNSSLKGIGVPNLHLEHIRKTLMPIPPCTEQDRIILRVDTFLPLVEQIATDEAELHYLISKAKAKVLDLAIRGKLVPQDPNDEPASVLLERIRTEKEELIKQGKIKRDKKESIIFRGDDNSYYQNVGTEMIDISDELPFDIPDSWCWCKLKDIVIINPRNKLDDDMEVAFIPMPLIEDGYSGNHSFEIRKWKDIKSGFTHFKNGDVGIAKITPCFENRKSVVFKDLCNGYGAGTTELHVLRPYKDTILAEFLLIYAKTQRFIEEGKQTFSGAVGQQRIGKEYIETVYFPIPPLQEQQRIIKQVNNLFNYLNVIETALS